MNKMNLKRISSKKSSQYKKLGRAFGVNLEHCIKEGILHCSNFKNRVKYYLVISQIKREEPLDVQIENLNEMMVVEFYE
jgi:hypothetical protein